MERDYYWYKDMIEFAYRIGIRGVGSEIKVSIWDLEREADKFMLKNGRHWTDYEAINWAYKWATKEAQYIDFEEVIEPLKLLS